MRMRRMVINSDNNVHFVQGVCRNHERGMCGRFVEQRALLLPSWQMEVWCPGVVPGVAGTSVR
jgi:hypothetical protein